MAVARSQKRAPARENGGETSRSHSDKAAPGQHAMKKVTLTLPSDVLDAARIQAREVESPSLSAYVAGAVAYRIATDQGKDGLTAFFDEMDAEFGPPSDEAKARAREFLDQLG